MNGSISSVARGVIRTARPLEIPQEHYETSEISSGLNWVSGTILANIQVDGQIDVLESDNSLVKSHLKPRICSWPDEEDARFNPSLTETPTARKRRHRLAVRCKIVGEKAAVPHSRDPA